jgi:CorA-like Mg2+ transporter protein
MPKTTGIGQMAVDGRLAPSPAPFPAVVSAYVAIAAIPTLLAGILGMNFEHMPEISAVWGYPAVLLVMGGVCLFLYSRFKKMAGSDEAWGRFPMLIL